jgi:hypothetical protein
MSELASEPASTRTSNRNHPETHPAPQAPTRGEAPARGKRGKDSPSYPGKHPRGESGPRTATTGNVLGTRGAVPGLAPARGKWGRDSPMLGGVTGGVIPPGENTVHPRMRTPSASEVSS